MPDPIWPPDADTPQADPHQKLAAQMFRKHGALLVEAAPGTGKTYLGVYLALCACRLGWASRRQPVLFLTFSRNARVQIENEARRFLERGWLTPHEHLAIKVANYHSFYLELLRQKAGIWGCTTPLRPASILEQRQRIGRVLAEHGVRENEIEKRIPQAALALALTRFQLPDLLAVGDHLALDEQTLADVYQQICRSLRGGRPSYDDFAALFLNLIEQCPELVHWLRLAYPVFILDEFQDTDSVQWRILTKLRPHQLVVLYDRFQMIYGWKGSRGERLNRTQTDLGIPAVCSVGLGTYHRSRAHTGFANFIDHLRRCELGALDARPADLQWLSCRALPASTDRVPVEARCLGELRKRNVVGNFDTAAILTRGNYLAEYLHNHLRTKKEPWHGVFSCRWIGGENNPDEVMRDRLHELRLVADANQLRHWIGDLIDWILPSSCRTISFASALSCSSAELLKRRTKAEFVEIRERLVPWWDRVHPGSLEAIAQALDEVEVLARIVAGQTARLDPDALYYIRQLAKTFRQLGSCPEPQSWTTACDRLEDSIVSCTFRKLRQPQRGLYVLTVHQSKGREFDHVIIPWLSGRGEPTRSINTGRQRVFPVAYKFDDPEDRRLLYVALTRAKRHVTIIYPQDDPSVFLQKWKLRA